MRHFLHPVALSLEHPSSAETGKVALVVCGSFMLYGLTLGYWRSPIMGLYVAVKMPLLIAATLGCNWLLNGLLGLLLGSGLGFRQSFHALLSAFAISGLILGSVAPVAWFLAMNAPAPDAPSAGAAHSGYLLSHTALIGIAGVIGLVRLSRLLADFCPSRKVAISTFGAWVVGNAFLGMQFSYIFRPFFGNPKLEVEFLRKHPMGGSFYDVVWRSLVDLTAVLSTERIAAICSAAILVGIITLFIVTCRRIATRLPST